MTATTHTVNNSCVVQHAGIAGLVIASGVAGLVTWEMFSRLIAPMWIGGPLDATGLIQMSLGLSETPAELLHLLTGIVVFPVGYFLVVHPLVARIVPFLPWPAQGLGYGVALWVFAMFVMASLIGGAPAFLGFQPLTWASLAGHMLMGLAISGVAAIPMRRAL